MKALRMWHPSNGERPRLVELLAIYISYRQDKIEGGVIREMNKPLNGVAFVPLYELRKVRSDE